MIKKLFSKNGIISLILLSQVFSCTSDSQRYGYLATKVKFPENNKFSVKVIPPDTQIILVQIKGQGLSTPITFELSQELSTRIIDKVPQGQKSIFARAIDINSNVLSSGTTTIDIIPNFLNKAELTLEENKDNKLIKEPCIVFMDEKDLPLSETKEKIIKNAGCQIIIPSANPVSTGDSTVPVVNPSTTSKPIPSVVSPSPIVTTKPCTVFIDPRDVPLSSTQEKIIRDAGCQIVLPSTGPLSTPEPTSTAVTSPTVIPTAVITPIITPVPTSTNSQSGGGSSVGNPVPSPTSSLRVDIDVIDGSPLPDDITITDGN